ncbi:hypothetical protein OHA21_00135 [Actinoplanes sp. NBC_00393]|uniref:hypothetical protein n=1 Tax=Actinoplanes sp. NBC_00393 TaxID=2975953 RepID=UPI002E1B8228
MTDPWSQSVVDARQCAGVPSLEKSMTVRRHPPVAITADPSLIAELEGCEQQIGYRFEYLTSIPGARRHARRRGMIIVGLDLAPRVRKPLRCSGTVVVAATELPEGRAAYVHRVGASHLIVLPRARQWLIGRLGMIGEPR